jgi:FHA domain-containing protein
MPAAPLAAPAAATTGNLDTFGGLAGVGAPKAGNPFADLLGPAPASGPGAAAPAVTAAPAAARDPFADLFGASSPGHPAAAAPLAAAPFAAPAPVTPPAAPAPQATAAPAWAAPPPRAADPFADPFASLLPPPAGVPSASPAVARAPAAAAPRLPENFDPFASLPSQPPPAASQAAVGNDPFAALLPSGPGPSIDAMFGLGNASPGAGDPLANFMAGAPAAHAAAPGSAASGKAGGATTDPIEALFGGAPPAPAPAPVQSDHVPALNAAFVPPRMRTADPLAGLKPAAEPAAGKPASMPDPGAAAEPPAPTPAPAAAPAPIAAAAVAAPPPPLPPVFMPAPVPAPASLPAAMPSARSSPPASEGAANADSAEATRLWAALCEGAGIHLPQPGAGTEAQMRDIGRILRSAVDGTLRLMAVRTSTRHEMRANVTIIQARNNNPLKFSPDAQAALEALLQPSMRGFLDGPAAMEDAMQDLVGHSIGSVAGMRAALEGVLDRFAPEQLESKLSTKSVLDSLLTGPRKARLWDLYLQHQSTIRDEAQDDFHALFGKAFLAAYEQQVAQLKRNARAAQGGGVAAPAQPGAGS